MAQTIILLVAGAVTKVAKMPRKGIVYVGTAHTGKSGKEDGRRYLCIEHRGDESTAGAGGSDDGHFRRNGLRWHATTGGCDTAADALNIPVEQRVAAASRSALSPEQQVEADIAAIAASLGQ
jgi:hypothetical protein